MNLTPSVRKHKVISLLLKAAILILSFWYIIYKLQDVGTSEAFDFISVLKSGNLLFIVLTFLLMFLNWALEGLKWKILIAPLETISFLNALKSVFAGVTVSIFMPNRVGEFAGRIFFLEKADKVEATLKNFVGSTIQMLMTLFLGLAGIYIVIGFSGGNWSPSELVNLNTLKWCIASVLVIAAILLVANFFRGRFSPQIQSYFKAIFSIKRSTFYAVFLLSLLRYFVFLFQYYLILEAFGVSPGLVYAFSLIAVTFLITSIIPSFALTEIVTRGAVAASLFQLVGANTPLIVVASTLLWIINLAIPALIGSVFIWKLKFFKS